MKHIETAAAKKWREVIERQREGDKSIAVFCRENRVAPASFYAWKRKLFKIELVQPGTGVGTGLSPVGVATGLGVGTGSSPGFVEATVGSVGTSRIQIRLRGGRRIIVGVGFDHQALIEVIGILEGLA